MSGISNSGTSANEVIQGTRLDDLLAGNAGDDTVQGRRGDDVLIYDVTANAGSTDTYDGGLGSDTLRLQMTSAHWNDPAVQLEIATYLAFIDTKTNGGTQEAAKEFFTFHSFGDQTLRVNRMEALEIFVDGVPVSPQDDPVTAVDDAEQVDEDGPVLTGNVLDNDSVPDLLGSVTLVSGTTLGALVLNSDGSYSYALDNSNPAVQALDAGDTLTDSFTYLVADADGDTDFATVDITINGVDDGVSGVMDFEGGYSILRANDLGGFSYYIVDGGLQILPGFGSSGWSTPAEGAGDGYYRTDDNDATTTNRLGSARIEGEGGTGTFSLKSLEIESFKDDEGDGWSVTFTGSNNATHTVSVAGTGSPSSGTYGTVDFGTLFTDVDWVDWVFNGDVNANGSNLLFKDYFQVDDIVFQDLQGTTPDDFSGGNPETMEFEAGAGNYLGSAYQEDGFNIAVVGAGSLNINDWDAGDTDMEFRAHGGAQYDLNRTDGGSFDLETLLLVQTANGATFTASNGATHTVAPGTSGVITFDDSFHGITSVLMSNSGLDTILDDITFANIEVV
ncbi:VCBS domain-containing protein [Meridianimarinicoccus sp. MJW13]|uniref:VCBS domain-containing protein n=1 Tax=Meridianimarinicoccus sp. MJW13 TaxID=2720031 RepID=UPI00186651EC|nr:VCBS domain-containing protein [Fluviibacterium sp. MJW13]